MDRKETCRGALTRLLLLLTLLFSTPAFALDFVFTETGNVAFTQEQLDAFEAAGDKWEDHLSDPVTVNVNVQILPLGAGAYASASSAKAKSIWTLNRHKSWTSSS